jgi:hypothetical protein
MRYAHPLVIPAVGFVLVLMGVLIPLFTLLGIIGANLLLLMASYVASVAGVFLGLIGAAFWFRVHRR